MGYGCGPYRYGPYGYLYGACNPYDSYGPYGYGYRGYGCSPYGYGYRGCGPYGCDGYLW